MNRPKLTRRQIKATKKFLKSSGYTCALTMSFRSDRDPIFRTATPDDGVAIHQYSLCGVQGKAISFDGKLKIVAIKTGSMARIMRWFETEPPVQIDTVFSLLVDESERQGAIGDFSELFKNKVDTLGRRKALRWAYIDLAKSIGPLLMRAAVRFVKYLSMG